MLKISLWIRRSSNFENLGKIFAERCDLEDFSTNRERRDRRRSSRKSSSEKIPTTNLKYLKNRTTNRRVFDWSFSSEKTSFLSFLNKKIRLKIKQSFSIHFSTQFSSLISLELRKSKRNSGTMPKF